MLLKIHLMIKMLLYELLSTSVAITITIKNRICHYSDDIIKIENFDFDKILLDEKS